MKKIINISDANEIQVKQKLSKNAKVTAWLIAGAIASVGIDAGIKYVDSIDNEKIETNYFATTGGVYNTPNEIDDKDEKIEPQAFYETDDGLEVYNSGRSK